MTAKKEAKKEAVKQVTEEVKKSAADMEVRNEDYAIIMSDADGMVLGQDN